MPPPVRRCTHRYLPFYSSVLCCLEYACLLLPPVAERDARHSRAQKPPQTCKCKHARAQVRATVTTGMEALQQERLTDPGGSLGARLRAIAARMLPAFDLAGEARQQ